MNKDFAFLVERFFTHYLVIQRNVSPNTISAYRDTFLLLFTYMHIKKNIPTDKISMSSLNKENVVAFLDWLEKERNNSITTRNQRLAAIHAFFKYVQAENVEFAFQCKQILSIPLKKCVKAIVPYLQENELKNLFQMPNTDTTWGRRDLILLCLLYDTGARVQEIIDLKVSDIRFEFPATVTLFGKGRKTRSVPLMSRTTNLLKDYMAEFSLSANEIKQPLFFNKQGHPLTRKGVSYIIEKYAKQAAEQTNMPSFKITPHVLRHTKAMHLLQAGVNLFYIRDLLGHVDVSTTEIYAKLDVEKKRDLLEKISSKTTSVEFPKWQKDNNLMVWLKNLGK